MSHNVKSAKAVTQKGSKSFLGCSNRIQNNTAVAVWKRENNQIRKKEVDPQAIPIREKVRRIPFAVEKISTDERDERKRKWKIYWKKMPRKLQVLRRKSIRSQERLKTALQQAHHQTSRLKVQPHLPAILRPREILRNRDMTIRSGSEIHFDLSVERIVMVVQQVEKCSLMNVALNTFFSIVVDTIRFHKVKESSGDIVSKNAWATYDLSQAWFRCSYICHRYMQSCMCCQRTLAGLGKSVAPHKYPTLSIPLPKHKRCFRLNIVI